MIKDSNKNKSESEKKQVFNNRYQILEWLLDTPSSKLYIGRDAINQESVLIKFIENGKTKQDFYDHYRYITPEMAPTLHYKESNERNDILIFEMKGPNIQSLFKHFGGKFSVITISMIFHLLILGIEKIHKKGIVHTNLKPSKIVVGQTGEEEKIYFVGFETCEKMHITKSKSKKKSNVKYPHENVFSPLCVHQSESYGYKDDLESLGYIIINYFFQGKLFDSFLPKKIDDIKATLVKLKSNLLSELLLSGIPAEIFDYFKYIYKLKPNEKPDYDFIKGLSFKLCQRFYVKNSIIACLDWVKIPSDEANKYRSKMLSYFFCSKYTATNQKKSSKHDDNSLNTLNPSNFLSPGGNYQNDFLQANMNNMPIFETSAEDQETSKRFISMIADQDDFELQLQLTPRMNPQADKISLPINMNPDNLEDLKLSMILEQNYGSQDNFRMISYQSDEIASKSFLALDENVILIENSKTHVSNEKPQKNSQNYITRTRTIPELQNLNYK